MGKLNASNQARAAEDHARENEVVTQTPTHCESYQPSLSDTFGRISLENHETSYVGSAHWTAILDSISELKNHFEDENKDDYDLPDPHTDTGQLPFIERPILLFGSNKDATKREILSSIPPRPVVDRLISGYFSAMDVAPIIHGPSFLREYEKFWENPTDTPVMWIGMLFAMMCLATQSQSLLANDPRGVDQHPLPPQYVQHLVRLYQEKTVQCLVLGKYTKSVPYTIQTLLLYFTTEHFQCEDTEIGTWILLGIVVRIAMRMGCHRDACHSPQISPFHGEMRRRAWALLAQLDLLASTQIGLPRMIKESQTDAAEPRNLIDDDFDEDMDELPASRPDTDLTPMLYVIVKNRIKSVFGMISDLTTSKGVISYAEIMRLDKVLHDAHDAIPPGLQMRPIARSLLDNPTTVMRRIYLALIINKAQCILHRKYLVAAHSDSQYSYSRQSCIDAALQTLQLQCTLSQETRPGGRLYHEKWKVSSLVNHDFLLATTILCLDLDRDIAMQASIQLRDPTRENDRRDAIIQALHGSYKIWLQSSRSSREARKAAEALKIILGKGKGVDVSNFNGGGAKSSGMEAKDAQIPAVMLSPDSDFVMGQLFPSYGSHATCASPQLAPGFRTNISVHSYADINSANDYDEMTNGFDWVRRRFSHADVSLADTYLGQLGLSIARIRLWKPQLGDDQKSPQASNPLSAQDPTFPIGSALALDLIYRVPCMTSEARANHLPPLYRPNS